MAGYGKRVHLAWRRRMALRGSMYAACVIAFCACSARVSPGGAGPGFASSSAASPGSGARGEHVVKPAAGVLTAGAWDDNLNFDRFDRYRSQLRGLSGLLPSSDEEHDSANAEWSEALSPHQTLDVALVIDTTGSMGDEIAYLQREFTALSQAIEAEFEGSEQRWALVVYRDKGDDYVARTFDFTARTSDFRSKLAQQSAGGGGDYPEAPDAALAAMAKLSWRDTADTARLAFWVADAPHHRENANAMLGAIRAVHRAGVHVYPVASSGVDELTELTMRTAAQLSGGRYLFLTDDSGVGLAHKEPSIPCYFVTRLNDAMLRMIEIELTGVYREPSADQILRSGGDPRDGACELTSGELLEVF